MWCFSFVQWFCKIMTEKWNTAAVKSGGNPFLQNHGEVFFTVMNACISRCGWWQTHPFLITLQNHTYSRPTRIEGARTKLCTFWASAFEELCLLHAGCFHTASKTYTSRVPQITFSTNGLLLSHDADNCEQCNRSHISMPSSAICREKDSNELCWWLRITLLQCYGQSKHLIILSFLNNLYR
jgi:hypothetical protein